MKKIYLLLCIIPTLFGTSTAQTTIDTDQTLSFDLLDPGGKFPGDFRIKKNIRYRYFIDNINRNVYTVTMNTESRALFTDTPPIFGFISDIDISKIAVPAGPASLTGTLPVLNGECSAGEKLTLAKYHATKTNLSAITTKFKAENEQLKKLNALYLSLTSILQDGQNTFQTLFNNKQSATNLLLSKSFGYTGPANDESALLAALRKSSSDLFDALSKDYDEILKKYNEYKLQLAVVERLATTKGNSLTERKQQASKPEQPDIQKTIDKITDELNTEKIVSEDISGIVLEIKVCYIKISEMEQKGFTENIATVYRKINQTNWQYISPSIKGKQDEITVKLSIEPKEGSLHTPNYAQFNGEYTGDVYGFKVNFSTGLFMLIGKSLFDKSYRIDTITNDVKNNIIIRNDEKQWVQPAVGALLHFYNKRPGTFSWGGALGFSISDETRLNYHGGISFLFGQEQRIILNVGTTLTHVEEISSMYKADQKVPKTAEMATVPTDKFYRAGAFLALTYNISN